MARSAILTTLLFLPCTAQCMLQAHPKPMNDDNSQRSSFTIADGNANLYEIGPTLLFYRPVRPEQSSSGMYSGGEPAAFALSANKRRSLEEVLRKAKAQKTDHTPNRIKGSYAIKTQQESILLKPGSPSAESLRTALEELKQVLPSVPLVYNVDRGENPWSGLTDTAEQEERNRTIQARSEQALADYEALGAPYLASYKGRPLLFRSRQKKEIVVNEADFSALHRPDATNIESGEETLIGTVSNKELLSPSFLLPFLIQGQIIVTYWHTDAEIRLTAETESHGRICYSFEGEHHYYTNEKNTGSLHFNVCVEVKSQTLWLMGR